MISADGRRERESEKKNMIGEEKKERSDDSEGGIYIQR